MKRAYLKFALVQMAGLVVFTACATAPVPESHTAVRGTLAAQIENPVVREEEGTEPTSDGVRALAKLEAYRAGGASALESVATTQSGSRSSTRSGLEQ